MAETSILREGACAWSYKYICFFQAIYLKAQGVVDKLSDATTVKLDRRAFHFLFPTRLSRCWTGRRHTSYMQTHGLNFIL